MYAKLENGKLIFAPKEVVIDGKRIVNPIDEILLELGYKPYITTPYPQDELHYKQTYEETEDVIILVWLDNEVEYWQSMSYEEAVNNEIRKRYSESQEFAILRQRDAKPSEYQEYYDYCEECKVYVKEKKALEREWEEDREEQIATITSKSCDISVGGHYESRNIRTTYLNT